MWDLRFFLHLVWEKVWEGFGEEIAMKKLILLMTPLPLLLVLSGCAADGGKNASISVLYLITAVASLIALLCYCLLTKKKDRWFVLLFSSVLLVNTSYFLLSVSGSLEAALNANRAAYLGSVFLPFSMMMIILRVCNLKYKKWLPIALCSLAAIVFLIAASPGILTIYYKEVFLDTSEGYSILRKVYGELHCVFMIYLFGYFAAMIAAIVHAFIKKRIETLLHSVLVATAVFVNIVVWLAEQFIDTHFEILSVSYIISELFLLGLHMLMNENDRLRELTDQLQREADERSKAGDSSKPEPSSEQAETFIAGVGALTPTERLIFDLYVEQKTTKDILEELNIKENTLKFHNKNIYGKLGVSSRKQLLAIYKDLNRE